MTRKLNIGCGQDLREGYINADIRSVRGADVILDDPVVLSFTNGHFDEILAHDVLEHHASLEEARQALCEWYRVLSPGGRLYLCMPNLAAIAEALVSGSVSPERAEQLIYGGRDYPENTHRCGFTPDTLRDILHDVGFTRVDRWDRTDPISPFNQCVVATKKSGVA